MKKYLVKGSGSEGQSASNVWILFVMFIVQYESRMSTFSGKKTVFAPSSPVLYCTVLDSTELYLIFLLVGRCHSEKTHRAYAKKIMGYIPAPHISLTKNGFGRKPDGTFYAV